MSMVVDTNVLVYAANEESPAHEACRARLAALREDPAAWFLTWPIVYEFLRVVTHRRVLERPWTVSGSWEFIRSLLVAPGLDMLAPTHRHAEVATATFAELPEVRGSLLHDAHTAILMREHGVRRILTHDADFRRFPFVEVEDPLRGG